MVNPNYQKVLQYCRKQIKENPFVVKAILIHVGIIVVLYVLSLISALKFESSQATLNAQVSNAPKKIQVIQATSISSSDLNKQISAYENHQQEIKQAKEDIKKAKLQALEKHKLELKRKAEAERKAKIEAEKKAALELKLKEQEKQRKIEKEKQRKVEQEKQAKLEAERKAEEVKKKKEEEAKRKIEQEKLAKQKAEQKVREERLAKARAEAIASAKREAAKNQAQSAISSYISEYQDRVGANWIKDSCRGIYDLPRAIIRNGNFIKLTGSSGDYQCDQSLIDAIKNTTPPTISNSTAKRTIQTENISFIFKQT